MNAINARKPVAADFMLDELDRDMSDLGSEYDYDLDESYDSFDMNEHFRSLETKRLRLFIQGKYEMEEGEVLAAFDAISDDNKLVCELAISYIRSMDELKQICGFDAISEFVLDKVEELKLNSAEMLSIHAVIIGEAISATF